jgi:hypothetical protein
MTDITDTPIVRAADRMSDAISSITATLENEEEPNLGWICSLLHEVDWAYRQVRWENPFNE